MFELINDSGDIICTRKENGALSLKGYKADIAEQKETINNFIISILQDQFNVPKSWSWSNNSDCEFEIVKLNRNSIEFLNVKNDFLNKMDGIQREIVQVCS